MKFRNPFNYDADLVSYGTGLLIDPAESMTQQHFADECDINTIVQRFLKTGEMPPNVNFGEIDVSEVGDFHDALNIVRAAQEEFNRLPSRVRERFNNEPARLMEFVNSESHRAEALALGLLKPQEPTPEPAPAPQPTPASE